MTCAMASTDACGGPSGNSFPLIQTVSAGATPESLARCANAASVRPTAIIPAKARRENISCSYRLDVFAKSYAEQRWLLESTGIEEARRIGHGPNAHYTSRISAVALERQHSIE